MTGKNKMFFVVMGVLLLGSIGATYWRAFVSKNYLVSIETACDPATEECFVRTVINPKTAEPTGEIRYYKIITKKASAWPACSPGDNGCPMAACSLGEVGCAETFCSASVLPEKESCNDPAVYRAQHSDVLPVGSPQGLRTCPTEEIRNQMPRSVEPDAEGGIQVPSEYFIMSGVRREKAEFDLDWVSANCTVPVETVY